MYDYYLNYCVCPKKTFFIGMEDLAGDETGCYPVAAYNVNGVFLGNAADKNAYIALWNADADDIAVGTLGSGPGPFGFTLLANWGMILPFHVIGEGLCGAAPGGIYGLEYAIEYE